jgi:hypothetical protein
MIAIMRILALLGVMLTSAPAWAEVELKNDGFVNNQAAAFQAGFVAGEIAASRFVAPEAGRQLLKVQLLYGGATATRTVTLKVFDDTAGTNTPGAELYSGDFSLTGSNTAISEIVTTDMTVTLPMQFRVGVVFGDGCPAPPTPCGAPSVASDTDNTIDAAKNYIFAVPGGWIRSQTAGLSGDWIIRAFITDGAVVPPDGAPGVDAGVGADCNGNAECPVGQFCENNACTFDCREDTDCGGGTCNSLGQCVGGTGGGEGGGCCQTGRGGGAVGMLIFGALFGFGVLRRRRR